MRKAIRNTVRSVDIAGLQDTFLVSAITMILVIRLQLFLTHYPQLGGGRLHIAHLLWGGLLMLVALMLLISLMGRSVHYVAAVVGGLGFGFFIDELGKFITRDNDYFFKPAAALIYLVFVGLYFATRAMQNHRGFTQREYLVNAVEALTEAARHDLDEHEKKRALRLLARADPADPLVKPVRRLLAEVEALPSRPPRRARRFADAVRDRYLGLIERSGFKRAVGWFFSLWALLSLLQLGLLALSLSFAIGGGGSALRFVSDGDNPITFVNVATLASSTVAGVLVLIGVWVLRRRTRLEAYRWFDRALMVEVFIGSVFSFVESQFSAVFGLGLNVLILATLRFMIRAERRLLDERATVAASA
jgi:hypothetical protein